MPGGMSVSTVLRAPITAPRPMATPGEVKQSFTEQHSPALRIGFGLLVTGAGLLTTAPNTMDMP